MVKFVGVKLIRLNSMTEYEQLNAETNTDIHQLTQS